MKFTVDWYGCDQDGWWVDFFEDGKEVDSSEFDNWDSMQDSCNQWYGRNES